MKFAIVDGARALPAPKSHGVCCFCGEPTTARCGTKRVWHWSHLPNQYCDAWWENETEWHRCWKARFPERNQEVVHFDPTSGEKHVADVKTDAGVVIELQNSPISSAELKSREDFYGRMFWIVNGEKLANTFSVLDPLPDPASAFAQDIVFYSRSPETARMFWRRSENPDHTWGSGRLVRVHDMSEIDPQIEEHYVGHHLYHWRRPREVWYESQRPVYIDFGDSELLVELLVYAPYDGFPLRCIRYVSKQHLIESNGGAHLN